MRCTWSDLSLVCKSETSADSCELGLAAAISAGKLSGCLDFNAACTSDHAFVKLASHAWTSGTRWDSSLGSGSSWLIGCSNEQPMREMEYTHTGL